MIEFCILGFLVGAVVTSLFLEWNFKQVIKYKAATGVDLCINGKFYTIRANTE